VTTISITLQSSRTLHIRSRSVSRFLDIEKISLRSISTALVVFYTKAEAGRFAAVLRPALMTVSFRYVPPRISVTVTEE
jgi:hypothetical protein